MRDWPLSPQRSATRKTAGPKMAPPPASGKPQPWNSQGPITDRLTTICFKYFCIRTENAVCFLQRIVIQYGKSCVQNTAFKAFLFVVMDAVNLCRQPSWEPTVFCIKPMTDDPSSPSKKLVRETRAKNSVRMSCILARVFSRARNLFRVGHSSIPSKFLVQVSRTSFLDGELGSSVLGLRAVEQ